MYTGVKQRGSAQAADTRRGLTPWTLTFIGIGGIIGAGFFLGVGLPIQTAGPSVVWTFLLAGLITSQVVGAVTSVAVDEGPGKTFQAYSAKYIRPFAGFLQGWVYYLSSIITIASESVAMAVFTRMWWPRMPVLWLAALFAAAVIILNLAGVRNFGRIESLMTVLKIAALAGFIVVAALWMFSPRMTYPAAGVTAGGWFPHGVGGALQAMLVVIFAYAGIGVFATAAASGRDPKAVDQAALRTVLLVSALYILSVFLVLRVIPWSAASTSQSPFVQALAHMGLHTFAQLFNAVILVASFSVMAGAMYSASTILWGLAEAGWGPAWLMAGSPSAGSRRAIGVSAAAIAVVLALSLVLPANVYNVLVSTSGAFTFFNWCVMLWTFLRWRSRRPDARLSRLAWGAPWTSRLTMVLLIVLAGMSLGQADQRLGTLAAACILVILAVAWRWVRRHEPDHGDMRI